METTDTVAIAILLYHEDGVVDRLQVVGCEWADAVEAQGSKGISCPAATIVAVNVPIVVGFG